MHLVMDNYATLSHPAVKAWLARNPRSAMHFRPTFGCRLNLGRGLVRSIERQTIRCDTPRCVKQDNDRISAFIERRTDDGAQLFRLNHDRRSDPRQSRLRPDHVHTTLVDVIKPNHSPDADHFADQHLLTVSHSRRPPVQQRSAQFLCPAFATGRSHRNRRGGLDRTLQRDYPHPTQNPYGASPDSARNAWKCDATWSPSPNGATTSSPASQDMYV